MPMYEITGDSIKTETVKVLIRANSPEQAEKYAEGRRYDEILDVMSVDSEFRPFETKEVRP